MDAATWIDQRIPFTAIQRGGSTIWPLGGHGLIGDSLGPVMHSHDGASEIFYFISGRCRMEVGDREEVFDAGDFVLVPPEMPHNLWNGADKDMWVFWLVAPNFMQNRWRTEQLSAGKSGPALARTLVEPGVELPSNEHIRSRLLTVPDGAPLAGKTGEAEEVVVYVVDGLAQVTVGHLSGALGPNHFVHVPVATRFTVAAAGADASFILFQMPGA